jgi:hypothetical protein
MTDEPSGPRSQGTSASYILGRLRNEGRFDLAQAVEDGRLSAFAAGEAAGYLKRPEILGSGSPNQRRKRQHQLRALAKGGDGVLSKLQELWLGPGPTGSLFNSREELEQAWQEHRDELMARWGSRGRRPMIWWELETDLAYPGYHTERSFLWQHGCLGPEERLEVETEWRREFDAARGMNAHDWREHLLHHDVPEELTKAWSAERTGEAARGGAAPLNRSARSPRRRRKAVSPAAVETAAK